MIDHTMKMTLTFSDILVLLILDMLMSGIIGFVVAECVMDTSCSRCNATVKRLETTRMDLPEGHSLFICKKCMEEHTAKLADELVPLQK